MVLATALASEPLKQHARVLAGSLVYRSGLYRTVLPAQKNEGKSLATRLCSYLRHYLETRSEAEATLFIQELGIKVHCDLLDHMLAPYLEGKSPLYERMEIDHCKRYCEGARHIVDVGANHGFWGLSLWPAAGPEAQCHFFEPNPAVAQRLRRTLRANPQIKAQLFPLALADEDGETEFYLPRPPLSGLGSIVPSEWAVENSYLDVSRKITIRTTSLDDLAARGDLPGIDLLKIDVERGEDRVVAGGAATIARFRPRLIMCETSVGSGAWSAIRNLGYRAYRLSENGDKETLYSSSEYWGNIFFTLPGEASAAMPVHES